uniref:Aminopeptidase N n=1 Tax=Leptobrachium leishanense TaxID=445787 RepID=A0A8C5M7M6_9ANUR
MGKGFYVSKLIAVIGIVFSIAALATIIALAVVYSQEKTKNFDLNNPTGSTTVSGGTTSTTTSGTTSTTTSGTTSTTTSPTTASTTPASNEPWDNYRLPKHLVPYHYDIHLRPVLEPDSRGIYVFHGKSEAFFTCVNATSLVIIHTNKLNYSSTILRNSIGEGLTVTKVEEVRATNYLVLHAANSLVVGQTYSLYTDFIGELADDLAGFYRNYHNPSYYSAIIATTQMQAPDARKAFPCFDEPALKATFNITLVHNPDYVALSNMNPISATEITIDGVIWTETVYDKTVKMSTYLVAFVVSQFTAIGDPGNSTTTGFVSYQKQYFLFTSNNYIHFSNIIYPLFPADQVAIPDFSAGAMENWGLMIYRESALLYDPEVSSISNKERIAIIIAHELAHQWFGNLVTIRWWNDLWLNEGFASYVEFLGADRAEPTWNIVFVTRDAHICRSPISKHRTCYNQIFTSYLFLAKGIICLISGNCRLLALGLEFDINKTYVKLALQCF